MEFTSKVFFFKLWDTKTHHNSGNVQAAMIYVYVSVFYYNIFFYSFYLYSLLSRVASLLRTDRGWYITVCDLAV